MKNARLDVFSSEKTEAIRRVTMAANIDIIEREIGLLSD